MNTDRPNPTTIWGDYPLKKPISAIYIPMNNKRKPLKAIILLFLCLASIHAGAQVISPSTELRNKNFSISKQQAKEQSEIEKTAYLASTANAMCLVQAYSFHWLFVRIISYHDTPYRPCNTDEYFKLTANSVLAQMRTLPNAPYYVHMPGVHFLTMDVAKSGLGLNYINVGTIRFFPIAISEVGLWDLIFERNRFFGQGISYGRAYAPTPTRENIYFRWNPGSEIYYLSSPKGKLYVMTSYTSSLIPSLTRANLSEIGTFINLPPGWTFNTKKLTKVLEIRSQQTEGMKTMRLIDEYENIYIELNAKDIHSN